MQRDTDNSDNNFSIRSTISDGDFEIIEETDLDSDDEFQSFDPEFVISNPEEHPRDVGVVTESIPMGESTIDYLMMYIWDDVKVLLATKDTDLTINVVDDKIQISGRPEIVKEIAAQIRHHTEQILSNRFSMKVGVSMAQLQSVIVDVGKTHNVIITSKLNSIMDPKPTAMTEEPPNIKIDDRGTKTAIVFARLESFKTDVLVNTTKPRLRLADGTGVSKSILGAGGRRLQLELDTAFPKGIGYGDIAVTGPGDMTTCKVIYHVVLPSYRGIIDTLPLSVCFKILMSVVMSVLNHASRDGHQTVAFPALATGGHKYPVKNVVEIMFTAFDKFTQNNPATSIKKIFVVIPQNANLEVKQLFVAQSLTNWLETRQLKCPKKSGRSLFGTKSEDNDLRTFVEKEIRGSSEPQCEVRVKIGATLVQVIHGDINKACEYRETIIVLWVGEETRTPNDHSTLKCLEVRQDSPCETYIRDIKTSKSTVDSTTILGKTLIHTFCEDINGDSLCAAFKSALKIAGKEGFTSLVFPVTMQGGIAEQPKKFVDALIASTNRMKSGVHVVSVIVSDGDTFRDIVVHIGEKKQFEEPARTLDINREDTDIDPRQDDASASMSVSDVDVILTVTSESEQSNRDAAKEVAEKLNTTLGVTR